MERNEIDKIAKEFVDAVKRYGTYTMQDKGAHEIYDVESLVKIITVLSAEEAAKVLITLLDHPILQNHEMGECLVHSVLNSLDGMSDDWFETIMMAENYRLQEYY